MDRSPHPGTAWLPFVWACLGIALLGLVLSMVERAPQSTAAFGMIAVFVGLAVFVHRKEMDRFYRERERTAKRGQDGARSPS